ncbi:MAG: hypothetical protein H6729_15990 [Deltaproteobacteria bacterium]|nr:hypothetical protein [Deltaproteobacteria bacterium]
MRGADDPRECDADAFDSVPMQRLLVTMLILAAFAWIRQIELPGPVPPALAAVASDNPDWLTIGSLWLTPLIGAFVLVELAALTVPAWRRLRVGGPVERARLTRAALVLGGVMSLIQGSTVVSMMDTFVRASGQEPGVFLGPSIMLAWFGMTMLLAYGASIISRFGLGSGFSMLAGLDTVIRLWMYLETSLSLEMLPQSLAFLAAAVFAGVLLTSPRYSIDPEQALLSLQLPRPSSSLVPLFLSGSVIIFYTTLQSAAYPELPPLEAIGTATYAAIQGVLTCVGAVVFSKLFNHPKHALPILCRAGGVTVETSAKLAASYGHVLRRTTKQSIIFLVVVIGLESQEVRIVSLGGHILITVVLTTIIIDLVKDYDAFKRRPDLVPVWPIHRLYAVGPALHALRMEGIDAHARGFSHRSLYAFFAPFVPVEIMVPADDAEKARSVLGTLLSPD